MWRETGLDCRTQSVASDRDKKSHANDNASEIYCAGDDSPLGTEFAGGILQPTKALNELAHSICFGDDGANAER